MNIHTQSEIHGSVGYTRLLAVLLMSAFFSYGDVLPQVSFTFDSIHASDQRNYQGVPSIAIAPNGRLWATYYCGPKGEDIYNYVIAATSGDGGKTWDEKFVIDPDGLGRYRACNSVFWTDPYGAVWLFWCQFPDSNTRESLVYAMRTENPGDENPQWMDPVILGQGVTQNKPIVTHQGEWLLPVATWYQAESCRVLASDDLGRRWTFRGTATVPDEKDRSCDEPMIVERDDGSLLMLVRTSYGIGQSESTDNGRTWTNVEPSRLPHTPARLFISKLASGRILLVKHGPIVGRPVGRRQIRAFLSDDGGSTWAGGLMIDERLSSYPDGCQDADGKIYIIYDRERYTEREILMSTFTEEDVLAGKPVSERAEFQMLINRAIGPEIPWVKGEAWPPVRTTVKSSGGKPAEQISAGDAPVAVWVGKGGGNNFRIHENWEGGSFPMSGSKLVFSGSTRMSPNNNNKSGMQVAGITFTSDAGSFRVSGAGGNHIELVGDIVNESPNTQTLLLPLHFSGQQVVHAHAGDVRIEGRISGEGALIKTGESTLILAAENDYVGTTHVRSGTLRLEAQALPEKGELLIESAGFLDLAFQGTNRARTLSIAGEKQAKGIWGAMGSGAEFQNPHITGTGTLKVAE